MKNYYRVMLGRKSAYAAEAHVGNYIGAGWFPEVSLKNTLTDSYRDFNRLMIPEYLKLHPEKSKIAAGLACGSLWTISRGIQIGDVVLCPDGKGSYYAGEVTGEYEYHPQQTLPHRRPVRWFERTLSRQDMGDALRHSTCPIGTVSHVSRYAEEIEGLLSGNRPLEACVADSGAEDPSVFALEKHLEDFLIQNWKSTELGKTYDIYEVDGELVGQQYPSDTGPLDILAISKDKKVLLIVELKRGRASDAVVGQIQRYMGYVKDELAEPSQVVKGVIIAFEDDLRIHRALSVAQNIELYTYQIQFKLEKRSK